ncbi:MAG TPA: CHAT domain-containing protein, partial [Longimicrobium sp.]|nr:CHAT domain-containing protein [Longimicrobium sp.]
GSVAVRRVRARAAGDLAALDACAADFRALDHPAGVLSVVMDAAALAHERGDTAAAARYRDDLLALVEETGMGMARDSFHMARIDLLTRVGDFGGAIELGRAAIAAAPGGMRRVLYEQMLANAFSFVGEAGQATEHARAAYREARVLGVDATTSGAAVMLANQLDSMHEDAAWTEAAALLREWRIRDRCRGDLAAALQKRELAAQALISRFLYSVQGRDDPALLAAAEREVAAGERMAKWIGERAGAHLGEREAARRLGGLRQVRAQLATRRGDAAGVEDALRAAHDVFGGAGLAMESANCAYLIGINRLNLANVDLAAHFGEAERALNEALEYYDGAGMRVQAADTRFMLAQLHSNAAPRVADELAGQLLAAAVRTLGDAEGDYDAVRRAYTAGPVLEAQRAKRAIAAESRRIYDLALRILTTYNVPAATWEWTQRAKARSLADALGGSAAVPARVLAALREEPEALALVERERELAARAEPAPPDEVPALRAELHALRSRMAADPRLADYLELRTGAAPTADDLASMLAPGERCVCVDWIASGDRLFLVAARPGGEPRVIALPVGLARVAAFARDELGPGGYRFTLRTTPELLRELDPLVAPLAEVSEPGELLVLSPTGPLHALPLHALEIDGAPLLARNPVAYTPSLGVLRHCLARGGAAEGGPRTAALFGDPSGDRPAAERMVRELAGRFGTEPLIGARVTRDAFLAAVRGRDIVHFQGHASHDRAEPLDSPLILADGLITAGEVYALRDVRAELVTLAACESAAAGIAPGDEPLGLIPAFLYAGARATLATLWPVEAESAARVMTRFYDALARGGAGKAEALRAACLELRADPKYAEPYYWAPFVLHGDWH